jgi:hypothetical protein
MRPYFRSKEKCGRHGRHCGTLIVVLDTQSSIRFEAGIIIEAKKRSMEGLV